MYLPRYGKDDSIPFCEEAKGTVKSMEKDQGKTQGSTDLFDVEI